MNKKSARTIVLYAAVILIGLATAGCEKLSTANSAKAASIPTVLGELVAVTPGASPVQSVLWFKQSDQTIVAVRVRLPSGTIEAVMTKFPRT